MADRGLGLGSSRELRILSQIFPNKKNGNLKWCNNGVSKFVPTYKMEYIIAGAFNSKLSIAIHCNFGFHDISFESFHIIFKTCTITRIEVIKM